MRVLRISHSAVVSGWRTRERELRGLGHEVTVVSARRWDEGGRPVSLVPGPDEPVIGVATRGSHPALFRYAARDLWRAMRSRPWDLLDIHEEPFSVATAQILALRWLAGRRTPYVLFSAQNLPKRYPVPFRWLERFALRHAAGAYPCNAGAARIMQAKGFPGRPEVIPLGFDPAVFHPPEGPSRPPAGTGGLRVGYAGRLAAHKGVDLLLSAAAARPDLRLHICGDGPQRDELAAWARAADLTGRVTWRGSLEGDELADFYRDIDVLAVPSRITPGWVEQFGRVAVEAMACGTPVVATDSGALPEVVGDGGLIVRAGSAAALGHALDRIGADPQLLAGLGHRAVDRVRAMTWAAVAARTDDLYRTAVHTPLAGIPPVHVVVVAFGRPELLERALAPLAGPVTVVDNSSRADVRAAAHRHHATYLDPGGNRGFGAGVNLALERMPGVDVLLLNPDARIPDADVRELQRQLRQAPDTGSIAPAQVDDDGTSARVMWPFPTPVQAWLTAAGLGRWARPRFGTGSVLMLRAEALAQVGGFDESFFLYAEETDWAYRASRMGWRHRAATGITALHSGAATSDDDERRETHFFAGQERFTRKHFGAGGWAVARSAAIMGGMGRWLLQPARRREHGARLRRWVRGPLRVEAALSIDPPGTP